MTDNHHPFSFTKKEFQELLDQNNRLRDQIDTLQDVLNDIGGLGVLLDISSKLEEFRTYIEGFKKTTYTKTEVDSIVNSIDQEEVDLSNYYTKGEVIDLIPEPVSLVNYYTKRQVDSLLDAVQGGDLDLSNYYTKLQTNSLFTNFFNKTDVRKLFEDYYDKDEIDNLIETGVPGGGSGSGDTYTKIEIDNMLTDYTTSEEVQEIVNLNAPDLSDFATTAELNALAGTIPNVPDLSGFATKNQLELVRQEIPVIPDLSTFATKTALDELSGRIPAPVDLTNYATLTDVNNVIDLIQPVPDVSQFVTMTQVESLIGDGEVNLSEYAKTTEVEEMIAAIEPGNVDLSRYATKVELANVSDAITSSLSTYATKEQLGLIEDDYATRELLGETISGVRSEITGDVADQIFEFKTANDLVISDVNAKVSTATNKVTDLQSQMWQKVDTQTFDNYADSVNGSINSINELQNSMFEQIESLFGNMDITNRIVSDLQNNTVGYLNGATVRPIIYELIDAELEEYYNVEDIDELLSEIAGGGTPIDLTAYAKKTDLDVYATNTRVGELETVFDNLYNRTDSLATYLDDVYTKAQVDALVADSGGSPVSGEYVPLAGAEVFDYPLVRNKIRGKFRPDDWMSEGEWAVSDLAAGFDTTIRESRYSLIYGNPSTVEADFRWTKKVTDEFEENTTMRIQVNMEPNYDRGFTLVRMFDELMIESIPNLVTEERDEPDGTVTYTFTAQVNDFQSYPYLGFVNGSYGLPSRAEVLINWITITQDVNDFIAESPAQPLRKNPTSYVEHESALDADILKTRMKQIIKQVRKPVS